MCACMHVYVYCVCMSCCGLKDGHCVCVAGLEALLQLLQAGAQTLHCLLVLLVASSHTLQLCYEVVVCWHLTLAGLGGCLGQ